jgi:hypothetical protein
MPDRIPFDKLDSKDKRRNFTLAFDVAAQFGIPPTLNTEQMIALERPDWQNVMSYVTVVYRQLDVSAVPDF